MKKIMHDIFRVFLDTSAYMYIEIYSSPSGFFCIRGVTPTETISYVESGIVLITPEGLEGERLTKEEEIEVYNHIIKTHTPYGENLFIPTYLQAHIFRDIKNDVIRAFLCEILEPD